MRGDEGSETGNEGECKRMHVLSGLLRFLFLEMNEVKFLFLEEVENSRGDNKTICLQLQKRLCDNR